MITGFSVGTVDELGHYEYGCIQWMVLKGRWIDVDAEIIMKLQPMDTVTGLNGENNVRNRVR